MENNLENKELFFVHYWGQRILNSPQSSNFKVDSDGIHHWVYECWLELKRIEDITDEDAIEVGKLVNCWNKSERKSKWWNDEDMKPTFINMGQSFAKSIGKEWGMGLTAPFHETIDDLIQGIDFLRSKGYLLPFNGLSVEQILEYGWAKYKNN